MENLYTILNCHEAVSVQELKKSYQELALKFHPDKSPGQTSASKFIKLNQAWTILGDSRLRKQYDVKWKERCLAQTYPIHDTVDFEEFDKVESYEPGDSEIPCKNEDEGSDFGAIQNEQISGSRCIPKVGSGSSEILADNERDNCNVVIDDEYSTDELRNENCAGSNTCIEELAKGDNHAVFASSDIEELIKGDNHAVCAASNIEELTKGGNRDSKIDYKPALDSLVKGDGENSDDVAGRLPLHGDIETMYAKRDNHAVFASSDIEELIKGGNCDSIIDDIPAVDSLDIEDSDDVDGRVPLHGDNETMYAYSCRCGGSYILTDVDVKLKFDIVCCDTCSLSLRVIYNDTDGGET